MKNEIINIPKEEFKTVKAEIIHNFSRFFDNYIFMISTRRVGPVSSHVNSTKKQKKPAKYKLEKLWI